MNLLEQLEQLIEKWETKPYTGDYTKATYSVCAKELRAIIESNPENNQWGLVEEWKQRAFRNQAESIRLLNRVFELEDVVAKFKGKPIV